MDNIEFRPYKWQDALGLLEDPNQKGLKGQEDIVKWAKLNEEGVGKTVLCNGEIISCGGVRIFWKGVGEAWLLYAKGKVLRPGIVKEQLHSFIRDNNLHRVQITLRCDWPEGLVLARRLGFKIEGKMRKYFPGGVDCYIMSIIKE